MRTVLMAVVAMAGLCVGQTKPNIANAKGPTVTASTAILIGPGGTIQFVTLDPSTLVISGGVLSAKQATPVSMPARVVEITQVAAATPMYTLGQAPNATAPELDVFWNGSCLSVGVDYTVAGSMVTFINGVMPVPSDVLRVVYRAAQ